MDWLTLGLGVVLGLIAGAFVWMPLAIRENDRRWMAKMLRAQDWRKRYPDDGWRFEDVEP